jgi:streptogramin lyase
MNLVSLFAGQYLEKGNVDGYYALFSGLSGITSDGNGTLFITDAYNHSVRKIERDKRTSTVAGAFPGNSDGRKLEARFQRSFGIAYSEGELFVADSGNNMIRKVDSKGFVVTLAKNLANPYAICVGKDGTVYFTEINSNSIKKLYKNGIVETLAGR